MNPNNQPTPTVQVQVTDLTTHRAPSPVISESGSEVPQSEAWGPAANEPISDNQSIPAPGPLNEALAATLDPIVSLQGLLPLDPPTMSVNVTTTTPTPNPPLNGGMHRVPPTIFDGT